MSQESTQHKLQMETKPLAVNDKGLKFDNDKAPMDLIPYEAEEAIAQVFAFGQKKYDRANWAKGIDYSRLISATKRHLGRFNKGEDLDDESSLNHIAHAACNLVMLLWMIKNRDDCDDRWVKTLKK